MSDRLIDIASLRSVARRSSAGLCLLLWALPACSEGSGIDPADADELAVREKSESAAPVCGNGELETDELCDGEMLGGNDCASLGFASGTLACRADCTFDTSACEPSNLCGNGRIDGNEECDGEELGNATCANWGLPAAGSLTCGANCTLDASACCPPAPAADPAWLAAYESDVLARLSGELDINGTRLSDRNSTSNRNLVRQYLQQLWEEQGLVVQTNKYSSAGTNVFATLPATVASDEWVVLGAHFDSVRGRGADDNASGTALLMATARYAASITCRGRNLLFVALDEEERGLLGANGFADYLAAQGTHVHSVHTADMVGYDGDGDRVVEIERADDGLWEVYRDAALEAGLDLVLHESDEGGTDHVAFRAAGFPSVGICEEWSGGDATPYYHTSSDTYDTIDFGYLASVTSLANAALAHLVALPSRE